MGCGNGIRIHTAVDGLRWGCGRALGASVDASSVSTVEVDRQSPGDSGNRVKLFQPATTL